MSEAFPRFRDFKPKKHDKTLLVARLPTPIFNDANKIQKVAAFLAFCATCMFSPSFGDVWGPSPRSLSWMKTLSFSASKSPKSGLTTSVRSGPPGVSFGTGPGAAPFPFSAEQPLQHEWTADESGKDVWICLVSSQPSHSTASQCSSEITMNEW